MQNIRYVQAKKGKRGWDFQREGKSVERDEREERRETREMSRSVG